MTTARRLLAPVVLVATLLVSQRASAVDFMFRATVDGETFEGKPLAWTDYEMHLLGRDGRLHDFNPQDAKDARRTSPDFVGYTAPEMRRELYREFGDSMDLTTTKHYIVVHPHGQGKQWADRFEQLYRSCLAYFRVRGFHIEEPQFPLVGIVYRNQDDYRRAAAKSGFNLPTSVLGHYENTSNRVQLFDATTGKSGADWSDVSDTIIHEATHQTAFNVGIHNRFADQPSWLVEGLAMMFEARGVWNSQTYHTFNDRINQGRFADFRAGLKKRKPGTLLSLVASDQLFKTDPPGAYAEAWALFTFLCETRPRELAQYLEKTAARPDFSSYFATQRVADFAECFGSDFKKLEANFLAWMANIK
jgi:Protein of unknown function (DUF1570)